jgi:hypothetical protein
MKGFKMTIYSVCLSLLISCNTQTNNAENKTESNQIENLSSDIESKFTQEEIAKYSISKLNNIPFETIKSNTETDYIKVFYTRKDGTKWQYKVKLKDNKIIWGILDGRWRDLEEDGTIEYQIRGNELIISEIFSDGSKSEKTFLRSKSK